MKKSTKKRIRDIRSALVMVLVMVAMLSTASYAWFTMTSSPTVTGLNMTATATSGLEISLDNSADSYKDAVIVEEDDTTSKTLKPVTPVAVENPEKYSEAGATEYIKFQEALYSGNVVTGLNEVPAANIADCVAKYKVYLKATDTSVPGTFGIGIICGDHAQTADMALNGEVPQVNGSVVRTKSTSAGSKYAEYAIRVGILPVGSSKMYIWEPNNDDVAIANATQATVQAGTDAASITETIAVSSTAAGVIEGDGAGNPNNTSVKLFEMDKTQAQEIDIFIWLQGSDGQCVDQIQKDDIEAQIQFTVVEDITT